MGLKARAIVHEWYDEVAETFRFQVPVEKDIVGLVLAYEGRLDDERIDCETASPVVRPNSPTRRE